MRARLRATLGATLAATLTTGLVAAGSTIATAAPVAPPVDTTALVAGKPGVEVPEIAWADCGDGFQCATVAVPLDYDDPRGATIDLALTKLPAADPAQRRGSVFLNFGGPGGPGGDNLRAVANVFFGDELRAGVDLIAFDPRGVGESTPVRCFETSAEQTEALLRSRILYPTTPEQRAERTEGDAAYSAACAERAGDLLDHVSTADVARDLDVLRAAVGDRQLRYLGYSYGTLLGSTYGALFPKRTGPMVLDGVLDPRDYFRGRAGSTVWTRTDADRGMTESFAEFARQCAAAGPACAFAEPGSTADSLVADFDRVATALRAGPVPTPGVDGVLGTPDDLPLDYSSVVALTAVSLYGPNGLPALAQYLDAARANVDGRPTTLPGSDFTPPTDAPYLNIVDAQLAVVCSETDEPRNRAAWDRESDRRERFAPHFGLHWTYLTSQCATWAGEAQDRYTGPFTGITATPPLIVGTRFDPATPYRSSVDLARRTPGSSLLTIEGLGHSQSPATECSRDIVAAYLLDGERPARGATCEGVRPNFTG